jgi:D-tyrosyl-tRNA(Tyr) deacylase
VRLVVQRVLRASVRVGGETVGEIGPGAAVLVGVSRTDTPQVANRMAEKLLALRYFEDADGRTNLDLASTDGQLLVVSQFTLYADVRHGRRPGFTDAALPAEALPLVDEFVARLREEGASVATGRFGAAMEVELVNDGPFTLVLDSDRDLGTGDGGGAARAAR